MQFMAIATQPEMLGFNLWSVLANYSYYFSGPQIFELLAAHGIEALRNHIFSGSDSLRIIAQSCAISST
jgi:hypothetical protein